MTTKKNKNILKMKPLAVREDQVGIAISFCNIFSQILQDLMISYGLDHGFKSCGGISIDTEPKCEHQESALCFLFMGKQEDTEAINNLIRSLTENYMKGKYGQNPKTEENPNKATIQ